MDIGLAILHAEKGKGIGKQRSPSRCLPQASRFGCGDASGTELWCGLFGTVHRKRAVPPGFAVLDTEALAACGGSFALDELQRTFSMNMPEEPRKTTFKEINMISEVLATVPARNQGRGCDLRFERLPASDAPLPVPVEQMKKIGTELYIAKEQVMFRDVSDTHVDIVTSKASQAFPQPLRPMHRCRARKSMSGPRRPRRERICGILTRRWRKQVEGMTNEINNHDQAVWCEVRRPGHSNEILVKELCLGHPHLTNEKHEHRSVS